MAGPAKRFLGVSVLGAARQRISRVFDDFSRVCVSFSGGKDSTVMLHLVAEEAARRHRRFALLFIDWEAQYKLTIEHVRECFELYSDLVEPYWVALPLRTTNACSQFEPEWTCWEPGKAWVRDLPEEAYTDPATAAFYRVTEPAVTFEEFVPEFGRWFAAGELAACFVGIRTAESLNRWRSIARQDKRRFDDLPWTSWISDSLFNAYPIYDWKTEDVWTYLSRSGKPYNRLYDRMHQAGLSIHQMRICEPYGDEQRRGLWLFHAIEPETWGRVVARVNGARHGALYSRESGNILGNIKISKPAEHTWKSFASFLLDSMPPPTAEHYRNKIAVWMKWYADRAIDIADELPGDTGSDDKPSWRRVCKMLLRNDYWCKTLYFSPTSSHAYDKYLELMRKRRKKWGIMPPKSRRRYGGAS